MGIKDTTLARKLDVEFARVLGIDETDVCCDIIPRIKYVRPKMVHVSCFAWSPPRTFRTRTLMRMLQTVRAGDVAWAKHSGQLQAIEIGRWKRAKGAT
jgi:hypothetical protein